MTGIYDAIVVGARCAGASTAMLLARKGYRVLLVDKAAFPSDTLSTHYIHQPGVAKLHRWGLLEKVAASGCPPIGKQIFDVGPFALIGAPPPADEISVGYAPRRTVLDTILVHAAVDAGVELRERFSVQDLIREGNRVVGIRGSADGGAPTSERARVVIGADGMRSTIARLVDAPTYNEVPAFSCAFYTYFGGVHVDTVELYPRPDRMLIAAPTNDGLTLAIVYWPMRDFERVSAAIDREFTSALDLVPGLTERVRAGSRAERFRGTPDLSGFFRKPYGPGWALVGDAGYHRNPITARGISDSFKDAESLAEALDASFAGRTSMDEALAAYETTRNDEVMPMYQYTADLAKLAPPPAEMQALMGALVGNEKQIGRFIGTIAGTVPIPEFFSPDNIATILGAGAPA